jgi:ribosome-binding protein aMBF1 (putative translation factor)
MKLSQLKTHDEVLAEQLRDPEFRAEWERTAPARAVASTVLAYRAHNGLSQRALASRLGMSQPAVARLERGDHNPTLDMLMRLASGLDVEFVLDIAPANMDRKLVTKRARSTAAIESVHASGCSVLVAAI